MFVRQPKPTNQPTNLVKIDFDAFELGLPPLAMPCSDWRGDIRTLSSRLNYMSSSSLRRLRCWDTFAMVFAAMNPDPATAGTPMPGNVESPQRRSPGISVLAVGQACFPASMPGPYVPRCLRTNREWVSGVPTSVSSARSLTSGMTFSRALHTPWERSSFIAAQEKRGKDARRGKQTKAVSQRGEWIGFKQWSRGEL